MKIESVRIENFRCFKDETVSMDNYTCFVGPNGSGKSTVLYALNVLFRQNKDCTTDLSKLSKEDFHHKNTNDPVKITVTFVDLSDNAKSDFAGYVRQNKLVISSLAIFDPATGYAEVKQYGSRLGIKEFSKYFAIEKEGKSVKDLKEFYLELKSKFPDLPNPGTKQAMVDALHEYEEKNQDKLELLQSADQFYGVSKGDVPPKKCTMKDASFPWLKHYFTPNQGGLCEAAFFGVPDIIGS